MFTFKLKIILYSLFLYLLKSLANNTSNAEIERERLVFKTCNCKIYLESKYLEEREKERE